MGLLDNNEEKTLSAGAKRNRKIKAYAAEVKAYVLENVPNINPAIKAKLDWLDGTSVERTVAAGANNVALLFDTDKPEQGATVPLMTVFEKTGKGYKDIRVMLKKWEGQGIKAELDLTDKVVRVL